MAGPEHAVRASLIDKERVYRVGGDGLHWRHAGVTGHVPFGHIAEIRLLSFPSLGGLQRQCTVRHRAGSLKIRSHHFKGLGNFEDRSATYAPFVRALCRGVATEAPAARCVTGSTGMWFVWLTLLVATVLIVVLVLAALLGGASLSVEPIAALAVLALLAPGLWRLARRGRQRTFDPANPPPELVGGQPGPLTVPD